MSKFTILIADDNPNNLFTLETLIQAHMEADIIKAMDGEEVLSLLLSNKPDLIILDVQMQRMDGFECAQLIRQRPSDAEIPILFLTASMHSDEAMQRGFDLGAADYLRKPIDDRLLINKINALHNVVSVGREERMSLKKEVVQTAEELERAQQLNGEVVAAILRGLVVLEAGRVVMTNPAFAQLIDQAGGPAGDDGAETLRRLECSNEEIEALCRGEAVKPREYPWSSGRVADLVAWLRLTSRTLPDGRVMVLFEDITERKVFEQTLRDALERAEAANKAKTEFLGNMSHEVRTPLNDIVGIAQLLGQSNLEPAQERYLKLLETSSQRLLRIVNDILDFSRVESGRVDLVEEPFDLWQVVCDMVELQQPHAKAAGLDLSAFVDSAAPGMVVGDEQRISQIVLNLVNNAIKFTQEGRVHVGLRVDEEFEDAVALTLSVRDTGVGIPADRMESLFERFNQGDASRTKTVGGTGLGLAITKALVQAMGGCIEVESSQGVGSLFSVSLRLAKAESSSLIAPATETPSNERQGARVLVVEDDDVNQIVVQSMLEALGCFVELADDGERCVTKAEQDGYDLILMDLHMPHMDGLRATELIREAGFDTPIVALTANILPHTPRECVAAGMNGYLSKPVTLDDLEQALGNWVTDRGGPLDFDEPVEEAPLVDDELPPISDELDADIFGADHEALTPANDSVVDDAPSDEELIAMVDDAALMPAIEGPWIDREFVANQRSLLGDGFGRMVEVYLRSMDELLPKLEFALASGDIDSAAALAHRAKGSSIQLGLNELVERARRIEVSADAGTPAARLELQFVELRDRFAALRDQIAGLA